jgi:antitoxin component YwqK of YwqJK toxin-antitoxin module
MIRQEITYHPNTYDITSYKEYYKGSLVKHDEYTEEGRITYETLDDGRTSITRYNKKDQLHGIHTIHLNGILIREYRYHNNKLHGKEKWYDSKGRLESETGWFYQRLFGKSIYYLNGGIWFTHNYYGGIRPAIKTSYDSSGYIIEKYLLGAKSKRMYTIVYMKTYKFLKPTSYKGFRLLVF